MTPPRAARKPPGAVAVQYALLVLSLHLTATTGATAASPPAEATATAAAVERLLEEGDYPGAITLLERDGTLEEGERALLSCRAHLVAEDWKRAVAEGEVAAKLRPDDPDAHLALAEALRAKMDAVNPVRALTSLGSYKEALARALELAPDSADARTEEIGYLIYAPAIAGGDKERARRKIRELEAIDLRQALQMGIDLARSNDDDDGWILALRRLVEHQPGDESSRFQLALLLARLERYEESDPLLLKLEESPEPKLSLGATYLLGRSRVQGRYELEQASLYLGRYLRSIGEGPPPEGLPSQAVAYWRHGEALALRGDVEGARTALDEAILRDPTLKEARLARRDLGD